MMNTISVEKNRKRKAWILLVVLLVAFFIQLPSSRSYLHTAGENLIQWGVEKAVSAATRELQKRARFE